MGYILGVSSGIYAAAKSEGEGESFLGISKKIYYTMFKGVDFNQIDLESIAEFREPGLKEKIKRGCGGIL